MVATLQSRKEALEAKILEKNEELKKLCLQEADLTGVIPPEIPLEPGEPPPPVRRRVGTSFSFPQNLLNNIKDADEESLIALEVECKVQTNIAEAALTLANDTTVNKAARRKHRLMYRQSQRRLSELEARLSLLRQGKADTAKPQQAKKKPRPNTTAVENLTYIWNKAQGQIDNLQFSGSNSVPWSNKRTGGYSKDEIDASRDFPHGDIFGSLHRSYKSSGTSKSSNSPRLDTDSEGNKSSSFNGSHSSNQFLLASSYPSIQDIAVNKAASKSSSHQKRSPKRGIVRRQWDTQSAGGTLLPNQTYPDHSHQPNLSRTQSLGSVEANCQRSSKVPWSSHDFPHDGNSSKEKEWYETSLDSAPSPPLRTSSRLPSTARLLYQMQEQQSRDWGGLAMTSLQPSNSHPVLPTTPSVPHRSIVRSASAYQSPETAVNDDLANSVQQMNLNQGLKGRSVSHTMKDNSSLNTPSPVQNEFGQGYIHPDNRSLYDYYIQKDPVFYQGEMKQKVEHPHIETGPEQRFLQVDALGLINPNPVNFQKGKINKHDEPGALNFQRPEVALDGYRQNDAVYINIPDENSECRSNINNWMSEAEYMKGEVKNEYPPVPKTVSQPYYHSTKSNHQTGKIDNLQYQAARNRQNAVEEAPPLPVHHPPHAIVQSEITFDTVVPFESPQNHTVVQAGKWQPYREVTKPFEMSDFYKYSTKFRQSNNNAANNSSSSSGKPVTNRAPTPDASRNSPNPQHQKGVYMPLRPMTCQPIESKPAHLLASPNPGESRFDDEMDQNHLVEVSPPEIV